MLLLAVYFLCSRTVDIHKARRHLKKSFQKYDNWFGLDKDKAASLHPDF